MIRNYLTVAIRNAMRHEMSYDAFRPSADRVYRIMKKEWNDRGQIEWRGARDMILDIFICGNMKRDKADRCRS